MQYVYLTKEFGRRVRRSGIADDDLIAAIDRAECGSVDADLGGGLIKQRIARPGKGRSGGFRTIIAYRRGQRAIFLHMFAKSRQSNLTSVELELYQDLANAYDELTDDQLDSLVAKRGWRKIER